MLFCRRFFTIASSSPRGNGFEYSFTTVGGRSRLRCEERITGDSARFGGAVYAIPGDGELIRRLPVDIDEDSGRVTEDEGAPSALECELVGVVGLSTGIYFVNDAVLAIDGVFAAFNGFEPKDELFGGEGVTF